METPSLEERCVSWGRVMRRQRSGNRVSLVWDGYYRAKHWGDDGSPRETLDIQDAWVIERAWADPRLFRLHKVILCYHFVYCLPPPHACRLIKLHFQARLKPRQWPDHLEEAMHDLAWMLTVQAKTGTKPLDMVRITA